MATPYEDVYLRFLPKITNYEFLKLSDEVIYRDLKNLLFSSIVNFRYCLKLYDRNEDTESFKENLTEEEIEILSHLMCVEYLTPQILTDEHLKQTLNSKDYNRYSQANHVKEVREIRELFKQESNEKMINYSFNMEKLDGFK
ncbi:hypothetical protein FZC83_02360 [Rossellomorea marisflavi]|uniref:Uncharacterized protein n=1 Tax=Rossellomorea marisflavi TaxID=189381 RepID=A0A5D4RYM1_9BACI|nr:hypothetical protein [Rossellomorea marisflavi]TYS56437.1 hypothetical protein FZC83_02360 [Rossellomorea marisflavi]